MCMGPESKDQKKPNTSGQESNSDVGSAKGDVGLANNIQNKSKAGGGSRTQTRA